MRGTRWGARCRHIPANVCAVAGIATVSQCQSDDPDLPGSARIGVRFVLSPSMLGRTVWSAIRPTRECSWPCSGLSWRSAIGQACSRCGPRRGCVCLSHHDRGGGVAVNSGRALCPLYAASLVADDGDGGLGLSRTNHSLYQGSIQHGSLPRSRTSSRCTLRQSRNVRHFRFACDTRRSVRPRRSPVISLARRSGPSSCPRPGGCSGG